MTLMKSSCQHDLLQCCRGGRRAGGLCDLCEMPLTVRKSCNPRGLSETRRTANRSRASHSAPDDRKSEVPCAARAQPVGQDRRDFLAGGMLYFSAVSAFLWTISKVKTCV